MSRFCCVASRLRPLRLSGAQPHTSQFIADTVPRTLITAHLLAGEPGDELGAAGRGGPEGAAAAGGPQQRAAQPTAPDRFRRKPGT